MREKLVYRSHFQPAPAKKLLQNDGNFYSSTQRRGSPYRTSRNTTKQVIRLCLLALSLVLVTRMLGWFSLGSSTAAWLSRMRSSHEWRRAYEALGLDLQDLPKTYQLPSGDRIPSVGLGTWKASPGEAGAAVKAALEAGYRHFDCAWIYGNENEIGLALQDVATRYPREDLFLTSKLWNTFHDPRDIELQLDETLSRLRTSYLDLFLIHWPVAFDEQGKLLEDLTDNPLPTWKKMEELVLKGKIRNIGVSNFNVRRLENLTASDIKIRPAINQVELNYWNPQPDLVHWSKEHDILLEAYSPLGGTGMVQETLEIPIVRKIAHKLKISPAQVLVSWHVQRGTIVLPKSVHPARISEDLQLFTLPKELFDDLEKAAISHAPRRLSDPSKRWGLDIFEDDKDKEEV